MPWNEIDRVYQWNAIKSTHTKLFPKRTRIEARMDPKKPALSLMLTPDGTTCVIKLDCSYSIHPFFIILIFSGSFFYHSCASVGFDKSHVQAFLLFWNALQSCLFVWLILEFFIEMSLVVHLQVWHVLGDSSR